jgi:serine/threonine-protein kinase
MTASQQFPRALGRYELVHLLGQGGMGEVYLAKISGAAGFEKPCIVKTVLPALLKDRQFLDRFHHEAKVLVHLVHSSIAQVYDMGEAEGTYYMALEYVAGVDLAYLLEQVRNQGKPMPVPVALYLGQRIAEGLGYAHRKAGPDGTALGIVHRDVSPHNVMVSYEGEVKVIDFGLAKSAARSKYTLPSTVMGKLGYMSPEQVRAEPLDHRSDIYSCGVVMWEMLAGQQLIPAGTLGEMMAAMSNPQVPSLHELRPDVDPALDAVVRRALAASPEQRYARTDEFGRALAEQLMRSGASLGAEEVGDYVRALCPEAFADQRRLLSSISGGNSLHRSPVPEATAAPNTARFTPVPPSAPPLGLADTLVRQGVSPAPGSGSGPATAVFGGGDATPAPAPLPVSALPAPSMPAPRRAAPVAAVTEVVPTRARESRRPVGLVLGALGLIAASVGVTSVVLKRPAPQPVSGVAGAPGSPPHAFAPHPPGRPPPPPPGLLPPHGPPPPREAGAPVNPEGAPQAAVPRETAQASTAPVRPPRGPQPPKPAAAGQKYVLAERVAPLNARAGVFFVPGGKRKGFSEGMVLQVVAGPVQGGKAQLLGTAKVVQAGPARARVQPDANVVAAGTVERLVVLPASRFPSHPEVADLVEPAPLGSETAPAPEPASTEVPAAPRELQLRVKVVGIYPFQSLEVANTEPFSLNDCSLVVGKRDLVQASILESGTTRTFPRAQFARGEWRGELVNAGWVLIKCTEGSKELRVNHLWTN